MLNISTTVKAHMSFKFYRKTLDLLNTHTQRIEELAFNRF